jgi:hypothetical protein
MATNFPTSLDSLTNPTSSDSLNSPSHSGQHANANDAIEALQVKVGINGSADTSSLEYRIAQLEAAGSPMKKVAAFTSSGTWTVPSGVTYAIAHIRGGGGHVRNNGGTTNQGGSSSVAFASGTITATGGQGIYVSGSGSNLLGGGAKAGEPNSGHGAIGWGSKIQASEGNKAEDGVYIVAGADVTAGSSITVTVGAGGTGSGGDFGADGGSGYVWIEYQES